MIRLYHCVDARSFRPLWALEELGLAYELITLPFPPRYRAREFLEINPLGTVPAFFDGDLRMTESCAIVHYLGRRYGHDRAFAPTPDDPDYGAWLNWLHFSDATLTFPQTLVLRYRQLEPGRAEIVADDYERWFLGRLRAVDRALQDREFLVGGRFGSADICIGYALLMAGMLGLDAKFPDAVAAYWRRLQDIPSFQAAKTAQARSAEGLAD